MMSYLSWHWHSGIDGISMHDYTVLTHRKYENLSRNSILKIFWTWQNWPIQQLDWDLRRVPTWMLFDQVRSPAPRWELIYIYRAFLTVQFSLIDLLYYPLQISTFSPSVTQHLLYLYNRGAPSLTLFGGVVSHVLEPFWPIRFCLLIFPIILYRFRLFPSSVIQHLTYLYNKEAPSLTVFGGVFRHAFHSHSVSHCFVVIFTATCNSSAVFLYVSSLERRGWLEIWNITGGYTCSDIWCSDNSVKFHLNWRGSNHSDLREFMPEVTGCAFTILYCESDSLPI